VVEACEQHVWGQFPAAAVRQPVHGAGTASSRTTSRLALDLDGRRFNAIWFRRTEPLPRQATLAYRPTIDEFTASGA
jgi:single-stranded-DNA-specific exonuclease